MSKPKLPLSLHLFRIVYFIAWSFIVPVLYVLAHTLVPKWKPGLDMKMGKFKNRFMPHCIWFHAVSVGELNALIPMLKYFEGTHIILSTSTVTAQNMAAKKLAEEIELNKISLIYMPWDHPYIVRKVLDGMKPQAIVLTETEIWPALIGAARKRGIKVAMVNARLSDSSFGSYQWLSMIAKWIFQSVGIVLAQSPNDSRKFLKLGVDPDKVYMTGNIKYASTPYQDRQTSRKFRKQLGYLDSNLLIVAASTHPEEEATMLSVFQELQEIYPDLRLVLAPRHPERFTVVEDYIQSAAKLETVRYSEIKSQVEQGTLLRNYAEHEVLMVDTIGDLMQIISAADLCFVGGTLVDKVGGHNVLEPASAGVPTVIGPYYFKNIDTVDKLEGAGGLFVAETKEEFRETLRVLISNVDLRVSTGAAAHKLVKENQKILADTARKLRQYILEY